jgi:uncharacterized protein YggU (UPF0235/DUF167 family)
MRTLRMKVKPSARSSEILPGDDGVRRADVSLRSGAGSRLKLIQIPD